MKIQFIQGDRKGQVSEGEAKYLGTLVKHGIAIEMKEEKAIPETKELKHKPLTKQKGRKRHV
jgi:hypothetical protein